MYNIHIKPSVITVSVTLTDLVAAQYHSIGHLRNLGLNILIKGISTEAAAEFEYYRFSELMGTHPDFRSTAPRYHANFLTFRLQSVCIISLYWIASEGIRYRVRISFKSQTKNLNCVLSLGL